MFLLVQKRSDIVSSKTLSLVCAIRSMIDLLHTELQDCEEE